MAGKPFDSEIELAAAAVGWLDEHGWEVYQEVQVEARGGVADLVAVRGRIVWLLECKTSLSLALLEQAADWLGRAHYVSLVTPRPRRAPRGYRFAEAALRQVGLGWLQIAPPWPGASAPPLVEEFVKPRVCRSARVVELRARLDERQKTFAPAGNPQSRRWTPFRRTCEQLRQLAAAEPGLLLTDAVARCEHHYKSAPAARSALAKWFARDLITGCHLRREAGRLRLYPDVGWADEG